MGFFLNLEQSELLRIQRYNEAFRFYFGKQWNFKREDGEPLVSFNYFRKFIDKSVEFLVSRGFVVRTPEALEQVSKPFIDEVWEYNQRDQFAWDAATTGAITGDVFALITFEEPTPMQRRLNPFSQGQIRINLLGSEQVYPTWDPLNTNNLIAVRIETIYYAERGTRQLDRDNNANHEGRQLHTKRFTQIITRDQIVEQFHGDQPVIRPNLLGEIPVVHIRNMSVPKEYYGLPDGMDLIDPQREYNEKSTDVSDTLNYHSAPVTIIFGAKAKQLERGPRQIWSGLPATARVETLKLQGDLTAANAYIAMVKKTMHELSDVPEGALGAMQPISNTSGVALHIQYQPLIAKTRRKRIQYQPGFEQINYFVLRIGMTKGLISLPFDVCSCCNGRIVEIDTGETTRVWVPEKQAFEVRPVTKKRCYHIDPQTLEFLDPYEMRVKYWRQYGFGAELRSMPLRQVMAEIEKQQRSFWDYAVAQEAMLTRWRAQNVGAIQGAHTQRSAEQSAAQLPMEQGGTGGAIATSPLLAQQVVAPPPRLEPPPMLITRHLPAGDIDMPEEPETVDIERVFLDPQSGQVVAREPVTMFLVPTGCRRPAYLNPFETKVEFLDVLPKDEALQAEIYEKYQRNNWVDAYWVQDQIAQIAADAVDIRRRMKASPVAPLSPAPVGAMPPVPDIAVLTSQAGQVPGVGGNPVPIGDQLATAPIGGGGE